MADEKNGEDMEPSAPDHSADAVRYAITAANQSVDIHAKPRMVNGRQLGLAV